MRMAGSIGQPPCGRCCGWFTKADNQLNKRSTKRREHHQSVEHWEDEYQTKDPYFDYRLEENSHWHPD